jgi:hypothetical protein
MAISINNNTLTFSDATTMTTAANPTASGNCVITLYTSPYSWTKSAALKAVKVTVVGAGGPGGTGTPASSSAGGGGGGASIYYATAASLPASPITITAGPGTNSFGPLASGTAGATGGPSGVTPGLGGTGAGGLTIPGGAAFVPPNISNGFYGGPGGSSILGLGGRGGIQPTTGPQPAMNGTGYGGGGGGGAAGNLTGGTGSPGIVIVEEFY